MVGQQSQPTISLERSGFYVNSSSYRRPGDSAVCYACTEKTEKILGWKVEKTLNDMCRDAWKWQQSPWAK